MSEILFANRVVETATASGTGPFALQNRLETYYSRFSEKFQTGRTVTYCALYNDLKEIGYGVLTSENQLTRVHVYDSSTPNGFINSATPGSPSFVDFPDGAQITIFNDIPAQLLVLIGTNGELVNPGPVRNALFVPDTAAMKALVDVADEDKIAVVGNGLFVYDAADAADPDNVDSFRLDDTTTGLFKRDRWDIQGPFKGSSTIDAASAGTGGYQRYYANPMASNANDYFELNVNEAEEALDIVGRFNQASRKTLARFFSSGTVKDRAEFSVPMVMPTVAATTGMVALTLAFLSGVSELAITHTAASDNASAAPHRIIPRVSTYAVADLLDVYRLKQIDPVLSQYPDYSVATVRGSNTVSGNSVATNSGNRNPLVWYWLASSSASESGTVVRPSVGAAASGAGRWHLLTSDVTQTFTSGVATPSVKWAVWLYTSGATAITNFLDGFEGQEIYVARGDADIVLTHDATKIVLSGRANRTLTLDNPVCYLKNVGGVWREIGSGRDAGKVDVDLSNTTNDHIIIDRVVTLTGNTTYTSPVTFVGNGGMNRNGYNVAFDKGVDGPVRPIFTGTGTVTIADGTIPWCYAEWFGATSSASGVPGTFSGAYINEALTAYGKVLLPGRLYNTADASVYVRGTQKHLRGYAGTALYSGSATNHILIVGDASGAFNTNFSAELTVENIATVKTVGATMPGSSSNDYTLPQGLRIYKVSGSITVSNIVNYDSPIGTYINNTGGVTLNNVKNLRTTAYTGQRYYGCYVDGERNNGLGYASPNATLVINGLNCGSISGLSLDAGIWAKGAISDVTFNTPEIGAFYYEGLYMYGDASVTGCIDVHVNCPIIDGWYLRAMSFHNFGPDGGVSVIGGYSSAATGSTGDAVYIDTEGVTISKHKTYNYLGSDSARALYMTASGKCDIDIDARDFMYAAVINACTDGKLNIIAYKSARRSAGGVAVQFTSGTAHIKGSFAISGNYGIGLQDNSGTAFSVIDMARTSLGSTSKVWYNDGSTNGPVANATFPLPSTQVVGVTVIPATTTTIVGIL